MTDPAPLREAATALLDQVDERAKQTGWPDNAPRETLRAILSALPTDAVQPLGGEVVAWRYWSVTERWVYTENRAIAAANVELVVRQEPLYATAPTAGSGWVMVPTKLPDDMIEAYYLACHRNGFTAHINASCAWEAFLSALPAAPTVGSE